MADVGVEVGQKMRLAIKAKLTELNCYVDDELPDYIMVMIANKRTKSQMKEDLNLFLATETSFFVEWLHIVLKKLKQVHVTNPNVFKNPIKRKSNEFLITQDDYKKIKKEEGRVKKEKFEEAKYPAVEEHERSLTDDLPITVSKLTEAGRRKITLTDDSNKFVNETFQSGMEDDFDIPLLSEINASNDEELEVLERRIKNVKSRLGLQVESDKEEDIDEDEKDCLNIKTDPGEMEFSEHSPPPRRIITSHRTPKRDLDTSNRPQELNANKKQLTQLEKQLEMKRSIHARIIFDKEKDSLKAKYDSIMHRNSSRPNREERSEPTETNSEVYGNKNRSILDRLGKRPDKAESRSESRSDTKLRSEINYSKIQSKVIRPQKNDKKSLSVLSRVGVMSKVSIPRKQTQSKASITKHFEEDMEDEDKLNEKLNNVPSVVKVKPRVLPEKTKQANPSLLFKAVAEAQRSVSQTPKVGKSRESKPATTNVKERLQPKEKTLVEKSPKTSSAPALFTKKYKEQLEAAKKNEELLKLNANRSIIINKNKQAKLLQDEKLKLRFLLAQQSTVSKLTLKDSSNEDNDFEDELQFGLEVNDDDLNFENNKDSASDISDKSSRTPELPRPKAVTSNGEEKDVFLKSKITTGNKLRDTNTIQGTLNCDQGKDDSVDEHEEELKANHKFIVTLDGIDKSKYRHIDNPDEVTIGKTSTIVKIRRSPSPIVFESQKPVVVVAPTKPIKKVDVFQKQTNALNLHVVNAPVKKVKEKCKYFPNCRQGERCEFSHPGMCKMFPNCKFAELCMYTHPVCKFEMSCTRKNCPYTHSASNTKTILGGLTTTNSQAGSTCKYFPNCSNSHCPYYHPKMCKYGMHCKNATCVFQHPGHPGGKLTWRLVK